MQPPGTPKELLKYDAIIVSYAFAMSQHRKICGYINRVATIKVALYGAPHLWEGRAEMSILLLLNPVNDQSCHRNKAATDKGRHHTTYNIKEFLRPLLDILQIYLLAPFCSCSCCHVYFHWSVETLVFLNALARLARNQYEKVYSYQADELHKRASLLCISYVSCPNPVIWIILGVLRVLIWQNYHGNQKTHIGHHSTTVHRICARLQIPVIFSIYHIRP